MLDLGFLVSTPKRRGSDLRRPPHDEPRALKMPLGDNLRHDLIGVVDALAALEAACGSVRHGKPATNYPRMTR